MTDTVTIEGKQYRPQSIIRHFPDGRISIIIEPIDQLLPDAVAKAIEELVWTEDLPSAFRKVATAILAEVRKMIEESKPKPQPQPFVGNMAESNDGFNDLLRQLDVKGSK